MPKVTFSERFSRSAFGNIPFKKLKQEQKARLIRKYGVVPLSQELLEKGDPDKLGELYPDEICLQAVIELNEQQIEILKRESERAEATDSV